MKLINANTFKRGWFIGDFDPSVFKTDQFEIAVKRYVAGDAEDRHYHKIATEYNYVVSGSVLMNDILFVEDSLVVVEPGEEVKFSSVSDSVVVVVKVPCVRGDKYIVER